MSLPLYLQAQLEKLDQQPQRQDGSLDQLRDLYAFANKLGLYDAADMIRNLSAPKKESPYSWFHPLDLSVKSSK